MKLKAVRIDGGNNSKLITKGYFTPTPLNVLHENVKNSLKEKYKDDETHWVHNNRPVIQYD